MVFVPYCLAYCFLFLFLVWSLRLEFPILCWIRVVKVDILALFLIFGRTLLFNSMLLVSINLNVFEFFPWGWFPVSGPCDVRRCLIWFQISYIFWGMFCVLPCGLSLNMFHVHLKIMYFCFLGWKVLHISIKWTWSRVLLNATISLLILCLEDLSIVDSGLFKLPVMTVLLSVSFVKSSKIFLYF